MHHAEVPRNEAELVILGSRVASRADSNFSVCYFWRRRGDRLVFNPDRLPAVLLHSRTLHRHRDRGCCIGWLRLTALARIGRRGRRRGEKEVSSACRAVEPRPSAPLWAGFYCLRVLAICPVQ